MLTRMSLEMLLSLNLNIILLRANKHYINIFIILLCRPGELVERFH